MVSTTIEQSKKLLELGIDVTTADMWWNIAIGGYSDPSCVPVSDVDIPAWSLSALLELIPESINDYTDNFSQLEITKKSISYVYADGRLRIGYLKSNLLDAVFEMVCWLLTNKLLTI
jgi:hypothetical protein